MASADERFLRDFARLPRDVQEALRKAAGVGLSMGAQTVSRFKGFVNNIFGFSPRRGSRGLPPRFPAPPWATQPDQPGAQRGGGFRAPPSSPPAPPGGGFGGGGGYGDDDDDWPDEHDINLDGGQQSTRTPVRAPPRPGETQPRVHTTPQSSNVFSFWFEPDSSKRRGTLYVCYKASKVNPRSVTFNRSTGHLAGTPGKTLRGKSNSPGPIYSYMDVPTTIYNGMVAAASKGRFVWDKLRVRGTIYGHQYAYQLVSGAIAPSTGAGAGIYIPRRATRQGFRARSVAVVGQPGRRVTARSTLPERRFRAGTRRFQER